MPNQKLSSLFNLEFITSSSIIFAGSFVVNVLNYIFTLIMSRTLPVEAFGEVTALFSLLLIISVPASALTMLMTRQAAVYSADIHEHDVLAQMFIGLKRNVSLSSFVFWVVFLLCIPFISPFLQLPYLPLILFSLLIPITLASALQSGTLQGLQEFFLLSKQNILSAGIKLCVSLALVALGFSVVGVMLGLILATLASWGYGYFATQKFITPVSKKTPTTFSFRSVQSLFSTILVTTLLLVLLSNIDVLLSKHYLSPELAGQYGALSTLGKILVYGVGAFITVLLPMVSAAHARDVQQKNTNDAVPKRSKGDTLLFFSLAIITLASGAGYALFMLFPVAIITLLLGAKYVLVAPFLGTFSIACGCISLSTALINYFVAVENRSFIPFLCGGILIEILLIVAYHQTLKEITLALLISSALLLVLLLFNYWLTAKLTHHVSKNNFADNPGL